MQRRPRVDHRVDAPVQIFQHMLRDVRADVPKSVGAGRGTGTPARRINSSATGWAGMRTPTNSRPAVTASGTALVRRSTAIGPARILHQLPRRLRNLLHQTLQHGQVRDMPQSPGPTPAAAWRQRFSPRQAPSSALAPKTITVSVGSGHQSPRAQNPRPLQRFSSEEYPGAAGSTTSRSVFTFLLCLSHPAIAF